MIVDKPTISGPWIEFEYARFFRHAFGDDRRERSETEEVLNPQMDGLADENGGPELLVQPFEPRCQIHRVAESCVVHTFCRSKVADNGLSDMNAKSREEWLKALEYKFRVEFFAGRFACQRRPASPLDMIRQRIGCVPEHHHRIADELIHGPAFGDESFGQRGQIA